MRSWKNHDTSRGSIGIKMYWNFESLFVRPGVTCEITWTHAHFIKFLGGILYLKFKHLWKKRWFWKLHKPSTLPFPMSRKLTKTLRSLWTGMFIWLIYQLPFWAQSISVSTKQGRIHRDNGFQSHKSSSLELAFRGGSKLSWSIYGYLTENCCCF